MADIAAKFDFEPRSTSLLRSRGVRADGRAMAIGSFHPQARKSARQRASLGALCCAAILATSSASATPLAAFANHSGEDHSGDPHAGEFLMGIDLSFSILIGTDFSNANLVFADMTGADLTGAILSGTVLSLANLSGSDLSGVTLDASTALFLTDLTGVDLTGADLSLANLNTVDLTGAFYDAGTTLLPLGFDPVLAGMVALPEPSVGILLAMGLLVSCGQRASKHA